MLHTVWWMKKCRKFLIYICSCYICNKSFCGFWELQTHLSTHDSTDDLITNSNSETTEKTLKMIETIHKDQKINSKKPEKICSICRKRFKNKQLLSQHAITHVDRKLTEVQCKICNKSLKNLNILRTHELIHNESTVKCPHCDKVKSKSALRAHIFQCHSIHIKHQCKICDKSFARPANLKVCFFER